MICFMGHGGATGQRCTVSVMTKPAKPKAPRAPRKAAAREAVLADHAPAPADVQPADAPTVDADAAPDHDPSAGVVPPQVDVVVDRDLLPGSLGTEPTLPADAENSWLPNFAVHEYRGRTLTMDKVTMSVAQRNAAIITFESAINDEDGVDL